jgi:hypothetical protein
VRVYVTVTREDLATLAELARDAWREPRDEAAWLLSEAIRHEAERPARRRRAPVRVREPEAARVTS